MRDPGSLLVVEATPPPAPADRRAALALACTPTVGPVRYHELTSRFGGADVAFRTTVDAATRAAALHAADAALERAAAVKATLLLLGEHAYPSTLLDLPDPPPALWLLGDASLLSAHDHAIAVVGTRRVSRYGERATRTIVGPLASARALVVSGMALGVDGVAHAAALDASAPTVAVLGTGIDVPYPASHRRLYARIAEQGAVVSEQLPGATGAAGAFPRRNRIIAALARATLVVEAGHASGALITAAIALDLGRTVAAVPGPIDADRSAGTNRLLRDGATLVADPDDALALLGLPPSRPARRPAEPPAALDDDQRAVWRALSTPALDMDALAAATGLPAARSLAAVAMLELAGLVETSFDGTLRRR